MAAARRLAGWLAVALALRCCAAKRAASSLTIGGGAEVEGQWRYLNKFGYDLGTGSFGVRFRYKTALSEPGREAARVLLALEAHLDEDWGEVERLPACERQQKSRHVRHVEVPTNGAWSALSEGTVRQVMRPHVWYFAVSDCQGHLPNAAAIEWELHMLQDGGSEFTVEVTGTLLAAGVKILLGTAFLGKFWLACGRASASAGSLHPVIKVLGTAAVAQYAAYLCYWLHLWAYRSNGSGVQALDVLGEWSSMLSQILLTSLSILLAQGYTILPSETVRLDILAPVLGGVVLVHLAIAGVSKFRDDAHRFHDNDGLCGVLLVSIRLALWCWFLLSMRRSYAGAGSKLLPFLQQFGLASSAHFLSYPVLFGIASLFAPYLRHKVMMFGIFVMQAAVLCWYTNMFLTRGLYFKVSSLGGNVLPTPKGSRQKPQLFGATAYSKSD